MVHVTVLRYNIVRDFRLIYIVLIGTKKLELC